MRVPEPDRSMSHLFDELNLRCNARRVRMIGLIPMSHLFDELNLRCSDFTLVSADVVTGLIFSTS